MRPRNLHTRAAVWLAGIALGVVSPAVQAHPQDEQTPLTRPEVEVELPDAQGRVVRAEALGRVGEQEWVGIGGRAYPVKPGYSRVAASPLPHLISTCLKTKAPQHRNCFARIAERLQGLKGKLQSSQDHPNSPLHVPPGARKKAGALREAFYSRMRSLIETTTRLSQDPLSPSPQALKRFDQEMRWFAAKLSALSTLQRGRIGLSVRGGSSMGAYQAGFLYYFSEFLKAHKRMWNQPELDLTGDFQDHAPGKFDYATGSSAGALNALLTASHGCKGPVAAPAESDYFDAWINVGMIGRHGAPGLRKPTNTRARRISSSFLSARPIEAAGKRLIKALQSGQGYQPNCGLDLGFTLTRLDENTFPLLYQSNGKPLLNASRARERFAFRLRFEPDETSGRPRLTITNRRPSSALHRKGVASIESHDEIAPFYLALGNPQDYKGNLDPKWLIESAMASGAVPLAFPPRTLHFTAFDPDGQVSPQYSGQAKFVDGGIFDNRPLDLAMKLGRWGQADKIRAYAHRLDRALPDDLHSPERDAWSRELQLGLTQASSLRDWQLWRARAHQRQISPLAPASLATLPEQPWQELLDLIPAVPTTLVFIEPTLTASDTTKLTRVKPGQEHGRIFPALMSYMGNFVKSARHASLINSVEQHPWVQRENAGDLRPRVIIPRRDVAIAGERLYRFMAFFERDFRIYDFFAGILDSQRFVQKEDPVFRLSGAQPTIKDSRFTCMRDYHRSGLAKRSRPLSPQELVDRVPSCRLRALLDAKTLAHLQSLGSKIKRLERRAIAKIGLAWQEKAKTKEKRDGLRVAEQKLAAQNFAAMIVAMHNYRVWEESMETRPSQAERFDAFFEQTSNAGFRYVDLQYLGSKMGMGIRRILGFHRVLHGKGARKIVRQVLEEAVSHLSSSAHRNIDSMGVSLIGKTIADEFRPYDPEWSLDLGLLNAGLELRLLSHPFYDRFRVDWARIRLHRIGDVTVLNRSFPNLPRYRALLTDLDFSFRLGARVFSLAKLFRVSAMLGPVVSYTYNLDAADSTLPTGRFMRRIGAELGLETVFLRRVYLELGIAYWMSETGNPAWRLDGQRKFDWHTEKHSALSGPCQVGRGHGSFLDCVQTSLSAGWRWDL